MWKRHRIFILILSIRSNGDQMNVLLLILHWIPISTLPSMECNSALVKDVKLQNILLTDIGISLKNIILHMKQKIKNFPLPTGLTMVMLLLRLLLLLLFLLQILLLLRLLLLLLFPLLILHSGGEGGSTGPVTGFSVQILNPSKFSHFSRQSWNLYTFEVSPFLPYLLTSFLWSLILCLKVHLN